MTCTRQGASVSDSTVVTVSAGDFCSNGATNFPVCTVDVAGTCVNGATNPPECTTGGSCSNGATDWPDCTPGPLSQGFTLGADRDIKIKTLSHGPATSETVSVPVNRIGSFMGTVSAGVSGRSAVWPELPDDIEVKFSVNGSPFSAGPVLTDVLGSLNAFDIAISLSKKIPDACAAAQTDSCRYYYVSVTGSDPLGLLPGDFTLLRIQQGSIQPVYQEE